MKKIVRIDLKAHEVARTITWYQLEADKEVRIDTLRCVRLRKFLKKHVNGIKVIDEKLLKIMLKEVEYRKVIGINIIKSLKI